jgi:hypothetical protein
LLLLLLLLLILLLLLQNRKLRLRKLNEGQPIFETI